VTYAYYPFIAHINSANATEGNIGTIIKDVINIVDDLARGLKGSSLSKCASRCTASDIVKLIADTFKVLMIFPLLAFFHMLIFF
jgi:hypothetical protein